MKKTNTNVSLSELTFDLAKDIKSSFPGAQPVTLEKMHLPLVDFLVCEKTDGVRLLLIVDDQGRIMFVDRNCEFYEPLDVVAAPACALTVLDGELVLENDNCVVFWVFDAINVCGVRVVDLALTDRLRACMGFVAIPTQRDFQIRLKPMFDASQAHYVWTDVVPKLMHASDGLIYTKNKAPYVAGTNHTILKWKPPHLNTVDFAVGCIRARNKNGVMEERYASLFVSNRGQLTNFNAYAFIDLNQQIELKKMGGAYIVAEFVFDPRWHELQAQGITKWTDVVVKWNVGGWKLLRTRPDKAMPNDVSTVHRLWRSIQNPIHEKELFSQ